MVARLSSYASSSVIADKVAQIYCEKGVEKWGNKYDIVLGGGYIKTRSPYSLSKGNVTVSQVQTLLPFENKIVLCSLNGTEINNKFIHSTNKEYHVAYSTYGNGVKDSVLYNSKKTYYVVTDTYTSDYHHLTVIDSLGDDVFAWNLLCDYLRQGKTF